MCFVLFPLCLGVFLGGGCGFLGVRVLVFFCFLGLYSQHMEVPRLGVESELRQPAYTTATATQDLS